MWGPSSREARREARHHPATARRCGEQLGTGRGERYEGAETAVCDTVPLRALGLLSRVDGGERTARLAHRVDAVEHRHWNAEGPSISKVTKSGESYVRCVFFHYRKQP
jgi:hypothetical protein